MKITIDTKEDSKDDIRRVIALLSQIADNNSCFDSPSGQRGFDIFSDNGSSASSSMNPSAGSNAPSQSSPGSLGIFSMFGDSDSSKNSPSDDSSPTIIKEDQNKIDTHEDDVGNDDLKIVPY